MKTDQTYAAVALKASRGFETITKEDTRRNTDMNAVIVASFVGNGSNACNIQIGVISLATPMATMTAEANLSMRLSEKYPTFPAW